MKRWSTKYLDTAYHFDQVRAADWISIGVVFLFPSLIPLYSSSSITSCFRETLIDRSLIRQTKQNKNQQLVPQHSRFILDKSSFIPCHDVIELSCVQHWIFMLNLFLSFLSNFLFRFVFFEFLVSQAPIYWINKRKKENQ